MNYDKHVHTEVRYIVLKGSDETMRPVELSTYVCDAIFGWSWLPDAPIFEADLVLVLKAKDDLFPAIYHPGSTYYAIKTLEQIAGLAGACYSASQGKSRATPQQIKSYVDNLILSYQEIMYNPVQGYYMAKQLIVDGKVFKQKLRTLQELTKWMTDNKLKLKDGYFIAAT